MQATATPYAAVAPAAAASAPAALLADDVKAWLANLDLDDATIAAVCTVFDKQGVRTMTHLKFAAKRNMITEQLLVDSGALIIPAALVVDAMQQVGLVWQHRWQSKS